MKFADEFSGVYNEIKTLYDVAAFCYSYLEENVSNQIVFIGEYIEVNARSRMKNPNLDLLNELAMSVNELLKKDMFMLFMGEPESNRLVQLIRHTENALKAFGDMPLNNATIPFFVLFGIDLFIEDRGYVGGQCLPLNTFLNETCLVYVNDRPSLMDSIMSKMKYPAKIKANEIRNWFQHLIFLKTAEIPKGYGVPKMNTLCKEESRLQKILDAKQIKIALIPVIREAWFQFSVDCGAAFTVKYDSQREERIKERVITLLEEAINLKFNIIVFPEYVCSPSIQEIIRIRLEKIGFDEPNRLDELLLVIAGSGWTADSNNVSCLYSYDGYLLGKTYKYSAYNNFVGKEKYIERLLNPGKERTLVNIPGVGIIQTEICRDVSENDICLKMARIFEPQFLLVVAWSASVNIGFRKQMDAIISNNRKTCAVMCNSCAAVTCEKGFKEVLGIVAAPQKKGSVIEAKFEEVKRDENVCLTCCENECLFEVCYDFGGETEQDVRVTCKFIENG